MMFNLGYLPGGSHAVFTTPQHSLPALDAAWRAPLPGGALTVCAYSGGMQGTAEARRGAGLGGCPARAGLQGGSASVPARGRAAAHSGVPSERDAAGALSAPRAAFTLFHLAMIFLSHSLDMMIPEQKG